MDKLWCEEEADTGASTDVELVTVSECINRRKKTWERGKCEGNDVAIPYL